RLPVTPEDCLGNFHLFYILLPDRKTRDGLLEHLNQNGIHAVFHYIPLHSSPMGQSFGYSEGDFPVTEELSGRLLRLPMYYEITEEEQRQVARQVAEYVQAARVRAVGDARFATSATNPPGSGKQRHDLSPAGAV
ncbi:MAG: DegT/DnrJ/EryC1/StrS family aminotransferase, partial [Planctomycetaceae bacterium]|nr:DegT/DnrJ/EryC1/StrS family aminotransferase [Planctomycetaceae bacterium]